MKERVAPLSIKFLRRFLFLTILCAVLAWSSSSDAVDKDCPLPIQASIAHDPAPPTSGGQVNVFFDGSGSMIGYIREPKQPRLERAYTELVRGLPFQLQRVGTEVRYHRFARTIRPLNPQELSGISQPSFYQCPPGTQGCDNQESRIASVLSTVNSAADGTLFVIVTDLFLTETELTASGAAALQLPLAQILESGKAIAIIGVRSSFNGVIFDLPSGGRYANASQRPFYVILVGPIERVLRLQGLLDNETFGAIDAADKNSIVFSRDLFKTPLVGSKWPERAFKTSKGVRERPIIPLGNVAEPIRFQQFQFDRNFEPPEAEIDLSQNSIPLSPQPKRYRARSQIWMYNDKARRCEDAWLSASSSDNLVAIESVHSGTLKLQLLSDPSAKAELLRGRRYIADIEITAEDVDFSTDSHKWLRDWSFEPADEAKLIAQSPAIFPTLNLWRLARMMGAVLSDSFQQKKQVVARFATGFQIDR